MRICIATDYYYPQLGGITEHVHGQAHSLAARGHEVTILTGRLLFTPPTEDRGQRVPEHDEVEIVHMGVALPLYGNGSQTLHTAIRGGRGALRRFFARRQFDVVHVHAPYNPSAFMLAPSALPPGTIGVGTYHSVFTPGFVRDAVARPTRAVMARLDGHVVVSDVCIPPLEHYFGGLDWRVIPNGVDDHHFRPDVERISLGDGTAPVVLFLGRFDPRNGLGIMLDAYEQLWRERAGDVRLCIVGNGPLRSFYERKLSPEIGASVYWAGRVDWNRPRFYASADIFCTPCQHASFGMVLLEAMSCGRPVVASRIPGFERLVEDGGEGLLVDPPDAPAAFAETLNALLDAPDAQRRLGEQGRRTATTRYAWREVAVQLEDLYRELRGDRTRTTTRVERKDSPTLRL